MPLSRSLMAIRNSKECQRQRCPNTLTLSLRCNWTAPVNCLKRTGQVKLVLSNRHKWLEWVSLSTVDRRLNFRLKAPCLEEGLMRLREIPLAITSTTALVSVEVSTNWTPSGLLTDTLMLQSAVTSVEARALNLIVLRLKPIADAALLVETLPRHKMLSCKPKVIPLKRRTRLARWSVSAVLSPRNPSSLLRLTLLVKSWVEWAIPVERASWSSN